MCQISHFFHYNVMIGSSVTAYNTKIQSGFPEKKSYEKSENIVY